MPLHMATQILKVLLYLPVYIIGITCQVIMPHNPPIKPLSTKKYVAIMTRHILPPKKRLTHTHSVITQISRQKIHNQKSCTKSKLFLFMIQNQNNLPITSHDSKTKPSQDLKFQNSNLHNRIKSNYLLCV